MEAEAEAEKKFWMEAKKIMKMEAEAEAVQKFGASTSLPGSFGNETLMRKKEKETDVFLNFCHDDEEGGGALDVIRCCDFILNKIKPFKNSV